MGDREDAIRASNEAFYRAFRERDVDAMEAVWARSGPVACLHPGMEVVVGRHDVLESWRGILEHEDAPRIHCTRVRVHVLGETAFVTCLEGTPALAATNVFTREEDVWRMVHHQAGPLSVRIENERIEEPPDPGALN